MEYEEIELLKQSEKSVVQLVREKGGGQIFIRKILKGYQPIYLLLQICEHPGLVKLYDVAMSDDTTTVIEEYIEGEPLGSSELSRQQFLNVVRELCSVLEFLHGKGIIHRDIKPSNIILSADGHIRLIDFDAARMPKEDHKQDTRLLGTRGYAPPEQYGFKQTDVRTDIYALGITLKQILGNKIRNPRYQRIIRKCTKLDPDKRYQSVRKVKKAFFHKKRTFLIWFISLVFVLVFYHYGIIPKLAVTEPTPLEYDWDAIQEAAKQYPDQVLWLTNSLDDFFGRDIEDVMEEKGSPIKHIKNENGTGSCSYTGIVFVYNIPHKVYELILPAELCTYNGAALNVNWIELTKIFEENPISSGYETMTGRYYVTYDDHDRRYIFYFMAVNEDACEISVIKRIS